MSTRKQRRRRAKEHRHEYVWEDAEGNELDPEDLAPKKDTARERSAPARAGKSPQPPSWRRTLKRGLVFAPVMFAVVFLLSPNLPTVTKITQTLLIVAIFVPFSYFLDGIFYRNYQRRLARREQADGPRGS
jgi:ferric-dicitrate binding protein FerR (iron transport regulator)